MDDRTISPAEAYAIWTSIRIQRDRVARHPLLQRQLPWWDALEERWRGIARRSEPIHLLVTPATQPGWLGLPGWLDGGREHLTPHEWPEIGGGAQ